MTEKKKKQGKMKLTMACNPIIPSLLLLALLDCALFFRYFSRRLKFCTTCNDIMTYPMVIKMYVAIMNIKVLVIRSSIDIQDYLETLMHYSLEKISLTSLQPIPFF